MKNNLFLVAGLVLLLGGCGGGGGLSASGNGSNLFVGGTVSPIITGFVNSFVQTNHMNAIPSDVTIPLPLVASFDDCRERVIGNSEADRHYKVIYKCDHIIDGGQEVSWNGFYEIWYKDNAKISEGYRQNIDMLYENHGGADNFYKWKGFNELTKSGKTTTFNSEYEIHSVMLDHKPVVDWISARKLFTSYTPDDVNNPDQSGKIVMDSFFKISGKIGGGPGGVDYGFTDVTYSIKSYDLFYDKSCANDYKSGRVEFKDGSNNVIGLHYNCDSMEVTLNGKVIDW